MEEAGLLDVGDGGGGVITEEASLVNLRAVCREAGLGCVTFCTHTITICTWIRIGVIDIHTHSNVGLSLVIISIKVGRACLSASWGSVLSPGFSVSVPRLPLGVFLETLLYSFYAMLIPSHFEIIVF